MTDLLTRLGTLLGKVWHGYSDFKRGEVEAALFEFNEWQAIQRRQRETKPGPAGMAHWIGDQGNDDFDAWETNGNVLRFTFHGATYTATIERVE